ncbi:MAG: hypothetical protein JW720_03830 [Sedimentisphaerales bacterium]|nr:hypothetical protein [Sedimentisphaerales bacterium]
MATKWEKISDQAIKILKDNPDGLRYSELVKALFEHFGNIPVNTIHGTVWNLHSRCPKRVYKPSRGLFRLVKFRSPQTDQLEEKLIPKQPRQIKEEDFYGPFADWLVNELEECTKAIRLGGNRFKDKWGTPDVIGKKESMRSDIIQSSIEIISAEIKTEVNQLVTAFGQACSYRLFSHKSYLVVPKHSSQEEIARLDSLCIVFGIGLILFNSSSPDNPQFNIRVRPTKQEPDMFYVNKYMKYVEKELFT